jgi:hypothetical protein
MEVGYFLKEIVTIVACWSVWKVGERSPSSTSMLDLCLARIVELCVLTARI